MAGEKQSAVSVCTRHARPDNTARCVPFPEALPPVSLALRIVSAVLACWLVVVLPGHAAVARAATPLEQGPVLDPQALLALAEQGDKRAAFLLGSHFASGRHGVRDDSEAVRWFRRAAGDGLAEAQYNLGVMYASGRGVPRDFAEAARWYRKAAEQGLAEAQFNLGTLYGLGRGVPRDDAAAATWLRKAARRGVARAQYNLGALHEHGRGVRRDGHQALEWYRLAAEQGFAPARERHAALARRLAAGGLPEPAAATAGEEAVESAGSPDPGTGRTVESTSEPSVDSATEQQPAAAAPPAVAPQPVPETAATAATDSSPSAGAGDEGYLQDWVRSLDPARYTMQVASFTDAAAAERLARAIATQGPAGVYSAVKGGKLFFSVVYGSWGSYGEARSALTALPAAMAGLQPWVRKVALIHEEMR